jgi:hypothetical protein
MIAELIQYLPVHPSAVLYLISAFPEHLQDNLQLFSDNVRQIVNGNDVTAFEKATQCLASLSKSMPAFFESIPYDEISLAICRHIACDIERVCKTSFLYMRTLWEKTHQDQVLTNIQQDVMGLIEMAIRDICSDFDLGNRLLNCLTVVFELIPDSFPRVWTDSVVGVILEHFAVFFEEFPKLIPDVASLPLCYYSLCSFACLVMKFIPNESLGIFQQWVESKLATHFLQPGHWRMLTYMYQPGSSS